MIAFDVWARMHILHDKSYYSNYNNIISTYYMIHFVLGSYDDRGPGPRQLRATGPDHAGNRRRITDEF